MKEICRINCSKEFKNLDLYCSGFCESPGKGIIMKTGRSLTLYCAWDCQRTSEKIKKCCYFCNYLHSCFDFYTNLSNIPTYIRSNIPFKFLMAWEVLKGKIKSGEFNS